MELFYYSLKKNVQNTTNIREVNFVNVCFITVKYGPPSIADMTTRSTCKLSLNVGIKIYM